MVSRNENVILNATTFETPPLTDFNIFLPFSLDFKSGKYSNMWRYVHLFSEFSPTLLFSSFSGVSKFVNPGLMGALGLQVHL